MKSPNQKPFCPQCINLIPTFTIENKQQKDVSIDCHCGYHSKMPLSYRIVIHSVVLCPTADSFLYMVILPQTEAAVKGYVS